MEGDVITTQDLFTLRCSTRSRRDGTVLGELRWTGPAPGFVPKLERRGVALPAALNGPRQRRGRPRGQDRRAMRRAASLLAALALVAAIVAAAAPVAHAARARS